jgi:hypothetical protein
VSGLAYALHRYFDEPARAAIAAWRRRLRRPVAVSQPIDPPSSR